MFSVAVTSSHEIAKIPLLELLVNSAKMLPYQSLAGRRALYKNNTVAVGWGLKPNTRRLHAAARKRNIPWISLEDGFFCYASHPSRRGLRYAIIADDIGIYYDATRQSRLEQILENDPLMQPELLTRANQAIEYILRNKISKYGFSRRDDSIQTHLFSEEKKRVLVVDQTVGDCSVTYGLATAQTFSDMLLAAKAENPDAEILVKVHPDVAAGKKKGYLSPCSLSGCTVISGDISPCEILPKVDKVYVVTSQLGFEALLHKKEVVCFGMPFYAGWGLTQDRIHCPRRTRRLTLCQLFAGACLLYSTYLIPEKRRLASLEEVLEHLSLLQKMRTHDSLRRLFCIDFSLWKKTFIKEYVRDLTQEVHFVSEKRLPAWDAFGKNDGLLVWGRKSGALEQAARARNIPVVRIEDGFLRSVGLGSDFRRPSSLVLDTTGIYYDPTAPSDLELLLQNTTFPVSLLEEAEQLRERIVALGISKYNMRNEGVLSLAAKPGQEIILVPGQVDDDASITFGCKSSAVKSNFQLLKAVRTHNPDAFIIYKEHPDVATGNRKGLINPHVARDYCDLHLRAPCDINPLINLADSVHTMTSLTGFEALLRHKKVVVYGIPCYAGWGLTHDMTFCPRRTRKLSLDELVCGLLLLYPRYFDWDFHHPSSAHGVIDSFLREKSARTSHSHFHFPEKVSRRMRQAAFLWESVRGGLS